MDKKWALILGASSGFGGASAIKLAQNGYHIFGVHLDRQVNMPKVNNIIKKIEKTGHKAVFFNMNAADELKRNDILDEIKELGFTTENFLDRFDEIFEDLYSEEEGLGRIAVNNIRFY